jgi:catabolite regulation protein CreA
MSAPEQETTGDPVVQGYTVYASVTATGWVHVYAESEEDAMNQAIDVDARDFEVDRGSAEVEFNVSPAVEVDG